MMLVINIYLTFGHSSNITYLFWHFLSQALGCDSKLSNFVCVYIELPSCILNAIFVKLTKIAVFVQI